MRTKRKLPNVEYCYASSQLMCFEKYWAEYSEEKSVFIHVTLLAEYLNFKNKSLKTPK